MVNLYRKKKMIKKILFRRHLLKSRKINDNSQSKLDLTVRPMQKNRIMVSSKIEFCYWALSGRETFFEGSDILNSFEDLLAADIIEGIVTFLDSDILITTATPDSENECVASFQNTWESFKKLFHAKVGENYTKYRNSRREVLFKGVLIKYC